MMAARAVDLAIRRLQAIDGLYLDIPAATASGRDLSGDHPAFPLTAAARDAVREALDRGETHYADVPGIVPLREAVAAALGSMGLPVNAREGLLIAAGEQEARFLAIQALAHAGYRLALPSVVHPGARKAAALGGVMVDRFTIDAETMAPAPDALDGLLSSGPVAVYLESPNRLTGKILERRTAEALAAKILAADAVVLCDATLAAWVPEQAGHLLIGARAGMQERVMTLGTLWAGLGVDDWLAAYLAGPSPLMAAARSLKQIIAICTTTPAQWGVLGALKAGAGQRRVQIDILRNLKEAAVRQWPGAVLPGEAVSVLAVRVSTRPPDLERLPARPACGEAFGAPGVLRFAVTRDGELSAALRALAASVSS